MFKNGQKNAFQQKWDTKIILAIRTHKFLSLQNADAHKIITESI